jgi:hypothetical protein
MLLSLVVKTMLLMSILDEEQVAETAEAFLTIHS